MPRIDPVNPAAASGEAKALLDGVQAQFGKVPNIFATFAHSPKALDGFLAIIASLQRGTLPAPLREQIALTVAGISGCDYCASAHTALGKGAGIDEEELALNLRGEATEDESQAVLTFVRKVTERHGQVDDADIASLRSAGFADGDIVEIISHIGINIFTNYFNLIAGTDVDFPRVDTTWAVRVA